MTDTTQNNIDLFDLSGKISVVTGAGRGIGKAVALRLARAGSDVALVARSQNELDSVAQEIQNLDRQAEAFPADLTQINQLPSLIDAIDRKMGGIDILVNNAGINIPQDSVAVTEEAWDAVMDINLKGAFFVAQAVGKVMISRGRGGRIINMTSQTGSIALIKRAVYCASKAGLNLITKVLALEWCSHGILVNAIAPTFIETELSKDFLSDPEFRAYALSKNLLKKFGTTDDVAAAVLYLASPSGNIVTGHVLLVDAGWTAH
jgi:2-deoxy-D-gluconate 3-dehydrogenase